MKGIFLAAVISVRLASITQTFDGVAGVTAIDLETGQRVTLKGSEPFPMASVRKVPIAVALLQRVDRGEVSLAKKVTLGPDDLHAGVSPIADEARGQPVTLTLGTLLERMLRDSDNSAVEYILAHYAPPAEVKKTLRAIGVRNVDVSRPEAMIIGQLLNEGDVIETRARYAARVKAITPDDVAHGTVKFWRDARDTATPDGMVDLFAKIYRHKAGLSEASEELLMRPLRETTTGADRIRAGVPRDAVVAHKTGTMPGTLNDAGIITSPDGKHHIVIAIFTKNSQGVEADRAKVVAALADAVYDGFTR